MSAPAASLPQPAKLLALVTRHEDLGSAMRLLGLHAPAIAQAARPGQFVMVKVAPGGEPLLPRPFSLHGAAGDQISLLYKVVGGGTRRLARVQVGDHLEVWGPLGTGFLPAGRRPVLVAGGLGAAPLAFLARRLAGGGAELVAGFLGAARRGELAALAGAFAPPGGAGFRLTLACEEVAPGAEPGLVTAPLARHLGDPGEACDQVHACGPLPMLKAVAALCAERGVPCQVSLEAPMACGVGACLGCAIPAVGGGYLRACSEGPVLDAARVDWGRL